VGQTVAHLTDFSEASAEAFIHALALALAYKHRFYLLHVKDPEREDSWSSFPHVREALARWGLVASDVARSEIEAKLGIQVAKVEIESNDLAGGIFNFILSHRPDVFVLATHGREGLNRLLYGSKAEEIARRTHVPAIFIGPEALTNQMDKFGLNEFCFLSRTALRQFIRRVFLLSYSRQLAFHRQLFTSCMSAIVRRRLWECQTNPSKLSMDRSKKQFCGLPRTITLT
jgi:nucleotide-binding universal stress UspA family protein